jgi:betaine/carnitine transporter, BCCT family
VNFGLTVSILLGMSIPLLVFPQQSAELLREAYAWIAGTFGWFYILTGAVALVVVLYIGMSQYGRIKLGDGAPEFSTASWISMLFAAGIGAGLMYWSGIEWAYYIQAPPFRAEPFSHDAYLWSSSYGLHHWGFVAWALYCLPTMAIAYPFYVRRIPQLKYSISAHFWLKGRENSLPARLMDSFFMVALIGGAGSSLGFSTPLIAAFINRLTGVPANFALELVVVTICVAVFALSVWMGLQAGIRRLSTLNIGLALFFLAAVLLASDTLFLLKMAVNSLGFLFQNTLAMTFWTDPIDDTGFVGDWTVFYWAWWIAYGPFVGLFVTRISKGRTLREVVVGMLLFGSFGVWLFFLVLGNHSLSLQLSGELDVVSIMQSEGGNAAVVATLDTLPMSGLIIGVFAVVAVIFVSTTYDSASYTLAASATQSLGESEDPPRWHRVFWAVAIAILPIGLMYAGGIKEAQTATLVVSLPLTFTFWLSGWGLLKTLREDHPPR